METIVLMGAEDVSRAGHNMSNAAEEMKRAAAQIEDSLFRHQRFLDDWLIRLEQIMTKEASDERR